MKKKKNNFAEIQKKKNVYHISDWDIPETVSIKSRDRSCIKSPA